MFEHFKNIETAFRHVRLFSIVLVICSALFSGYCLYESYQMANASQSRIYLLANGKALEAFASGRKDNILVEAKDHIAMFHHYFFTLDPDDKVIQANMKRAFYLADEAAKKQYDDLSENGYFSSIISGNVSQQIEMDSVQLSLQSYPYYFRYYGIQTIIRPSAIAKRVLVTEGYLRNISRSDNNSHGFLIERWRILDNHDLSIQKR